MRLLNKGAPSMLVSPENREIVHKLKAMGFNVIPTEPVDELISYERYHADMQLLIIKNTAFISGNSEYIVDYLKGYNYDLVICENLQGKYPNNVLLNAALVGDKLLCKYDSLSSKVQKLCKEESVEIIDVKQGYTKCSTLVLSEKAIITADTKIYNKALSNSIDALLIKPGFIELEGADYGFIGGCSGVVGDSVIFFGDINTHPDSKMIIAFIKKYKLNIISLLDGTLKDIGGFVLINS